MKLLGRPQATRSAARVIALAPPLLLVLPLLLAAPGCGRRATTGVGVTTDARTDADEPWPDGGWPDAIRLDAPTSCGNGLCDPSESCSSCRADCGPCPGCGDGRCNDRGDESCDSCPEDCGRCVARCGDGRCGDGESCGNCPADCGSCGGCGDGQCAPGESCSTCPRDCGLCPSCPDGKCGAGEDCRSCAQDCGVCKTCGDGFCTDSEDCLSCAPDCGACKTCGDGLCDPASETCFLCPQDCGKCSGCGDGKCQSGETCASCQADCGVCSVCGNTKCEPPYETCSNCSKDCGPCQLKGCLDVLLCSFGCMQAGSISLSCVANCAAQGCADVQFFVDQAFGCAIQHIQDCGIGGGAGPELLQCFQQYCAAELSACMAAKCSP